MVGPSQGSSPVAFDWSSTAELIKSSCTTGALYQVLDLMEANDNHSEEHTVAEFIEFCVNGRTSKSGGSQKRPFHRRACVPSDKFLVTLAWMPWGAWHLCCSDISRSGQWASKGVGLGLGHWRGVR